MRDLPRRFGPIDSEEVADLLDRMANDIRLEERIGRMLLDGCNSGELGDLILSTLESYQEQIASEPKE